MKEFHRGKFFVFDKANIWNYFFRRRFFEKKHPAKMVCYPSEFYSKNFLITFVNPKQKMMLLIQKIEFC